MSAIPLRDGRPRWLKNTGELLPFDPAVEIPRHLTILVTRWPPVPSSFNQFKEQEYFGLYTGPTSIAYFFYTLRDDLPTEIEGKSPLEWARAYLACSAKREEEYGPESDQNMPISSSWCGAFVDQFWHAALNAAIDGNEAHLQVIWDALPAILTDADPNAKRMVGGQADEWPTGRAAFLHLLRAVSKWVPSVQDRVRQAEHQVIEAIWRRNPDTAQPWFWTGRYYLGAGHGWMSTLPQVLLSDSTEARAQEMKPWIEKIIGLQFPSGNWPKYCLQPQLNGKPLAEGEDDMVQIGHGAPGVVCALLTLKPIYHRLGDVVMVQTIDEAVQKAQETIWERGLLSKESSILHGAAGNSLALLDRERQATFLARSLQEEIDEGVASGRFEQSEGDSGLGKGLAGRLACFVLYEKGKVGVLPSFNDF